MNLPDQQRLLWDVVRGARAIDRDVESAFATPPRGRLRDRLQLYVDMYRWRHLDAIRATFPVLARVMGADLAPIVAGFVAAHPSVDPSLDHLGRTLHSWLRSRGFDAPADLAAFELARSDVFDAIDEGSLPFAEFVSRAAEAPSLGFRFVAALRLVTIRHVVSAPTAGAPAIGHHLVWRRDARVVDAPIGPAEASALASMLEGRSLGESCGAFSAEPEPEIAAARAVGSWFAEGLVAAIVSSEPVAATSP